MRIRKGIIERIVAHARREAPIEACGFLMGSSGLATRDFPITNADGREDHYTFDPDEQLRAYSVASEEGLDIMAVYHSHPKGPAQPSAEDIRLAHDPTISYVIVSLLEGKAMVKAFSIKNGSVGEKPLLIE
ncbi:MAG TPA: M67 family metallopeptidase [Syntrophorhabdales bacterium]|nr:M67 family metallopeptidase [Syntrophorhabdales bacterium]